MSKPSEKDLPDAHQIRAEIEAKALAFGFEKLAITDPDLSAYDPHVRQWLASGFAGDMGYLERNLEKRLHPELLEPGTCRVISARMNYLPTDTRPIEILENSSKAYISRYALGRDYLKVLRQRLAKLATEIDSLLGQSQHSFGSELRYRAFTDSAPVLEKALGEKAGLGWIGKHTLLLDESVGSWFFLGEIYTNAPLPIDATPVANACGKCNACITVCPTKAIVAPQTLDARRCISYLTIEHKGSIDPSLRSLMGNRIYGCDDCQLFCPWNREAPTTSEPDFAVRHGLDSRDLIDLFSLSEAQFLDLTTGSAMRRIGYAQWQRNIAIALGNSGAGEPALAALQAGIGRVNTMVDEHIHWAITELNR